MSFAYLLQRLPVRASAGLQLSIVMLLIAGLSLTSPGAEAVGGGPVDKIMHLLRMGLLVLAASLMLWASGERWADLGLRRPRHWRIIPLAVVAGYLGVIVAAGVVITVVLPTFGLARPDLSVFAGIRGDLGEYLFWVGPSALGAAALGEELIARGFLLDRLRKLIGGPDQAATYAAVVLQGLLFGAGHLYQGLGGVLVTGAVGIVLGLVWLWSGRNLWAPVILHGLVNVVSISAAFFGAAPAG